VTSPLPPGGSQTLTLVVTVKNAMAGSDRQFAVRATSEDDPSAFDRVRATVHVT
jgi:hypothetical protein